MKTIHLGTFEMWFLSAGGFYIQVVVRASLTILGM